MKIHLKSYRFKIICIKIYIYIYIILLCKYISQRYSFFNFIKNFVPCIKYINIFHFSFFKLIIYLDTRSKNCKKYI